MNPQTEIFLRNLTKQHSTFVAVILRKSMVIKANLLCLQEVFKTKKSGVYGSKCSGKPPGT